MSRRFANFDEFFTFYMSEHSDQRSRRLHLVGTLLFIICWALAALWADWRWFLAGPLIGYAFAWVGHFMFEKNRPATFRHPLYSLRGDFVMLWHWLSGRLRW
ncbi:MAG: DUF962 domain-containing protein [Steroidobacteraceae bacterium]